MTKLNYKAVEGLLKLMPNRKDELIKTILKLDFARRSGWAWAFSLQTQTEALYNQHHQRYTELQALQTDLEEQLKNDGMPDAPDCCWNDLSKHLIDVIKQLYEQAKKIVECPICMEIIEPKKLHISSCGHLICIPCFKQLPIEQKGNCHFKNCPICRAKVYVNTEKEEEE